AVVIGSNIVYQVTETLASVHVVARVLYWMFYFIYQDFLRSLVWVVGYVSAVSMIAGCL
ncbi:hypothetical protein CWC26_21475, partial [Pseudoalteromonas sp. S4488]